MLVTSRFSWKIKSRKNLQNFLIIFKKKKNLIFLKKKRFYLFPSGTSIYARFVRQNQSESRFCHFHSLSPHFQARICLELGYGLESIFPLGSLYRFQMIKRPVQFSCARSLSFFLFWFFSTSASAWRRTKNDYAVNIRNCGSLCYFIPEPRQRRKYINYVFSATLWFSNFGINFQWRQSLP